MKKFPFSTIICTAAVLISCIIILAFGMPKGLPREEDTQFSSGSGIQIDHLTDLQADSLFKLGKVWGYVKYRHPSVIDGSINWDAELFRVMPSLLEAGSAEEANGILFRWLGGFPFEISEPDAVSQYWMERQKNGGTSLDTSWIEDAAYLGSDLSGYLCRLSQVLVSDRRDSYAYLDGRDGLISFDNEQFLTFDPQDDGAKLLSLFRFWNIYEYYSPNQALTIQDWDEVLRQAIPKMPSADTQKEYVLSIAETAALTGDAHISVSDPADTVDTYYGTFFLPCSFLTIDGKVVVSDATAPDTGDRLEPGDVIESIDGTTIEERIQTLSRYTPLPETDKFAVALSSSLLRTSGSTSEVVVTRGSEELTLHVNALQDSFTQEDSPRSKLIEDGQIGYISPVMSSEEELIETMNKMEGTKGLIIDLRMYPSNLIRFSLPEYLMTESAEFAQVSFPNPVSPGSFITSPQSCGTVSKRNGYAKDRFHYEGKVIILMDETTMSRAEYTVMALRQAPGAVVVGTPSCGADGDVVSVTLPGNVSMNISSRGIYTPEGGQTQRIGLEPDIPCAPTIEGIKEGRDELIEKATEIILEDSTSAP